MTDIFSLVWAPTSAGRLILLGVLILGCKILATLAQLWWARGDYRAPPTGGGSQVAYVAGKVTPALACLCLSAGAALAREPDQAWQFGLLGAVAAVLAIQVVRLRRAGRFFGLADHVATLLRQRR